jgi:hypothetical protein
MEKLPAKKMIEFRKLSERRKSTFIKNLKFPKPKEKSGGDYWISCITAITAACEEGDPRIIRERIDDLLGRHERTPHAHIKLEYKRNIDILKKYKGDDFSWLRPRRNLEFFKISKKKSILQISGLPIQVIPTNVFKFKSNGVEQIGAFWFIAQKEGYTKGELSIFADLLYRYLLNYYSEDYEINPNYCIAIDVVKSLEVKHSINLKKGNSLLDITLNEIKEALKK